MIKFYTGKRKRQREEREILKRVTERRRYSLEYKRYITNTTVRFVLFRTLELRTNERTGTKGLAVEKPENTDRLIGAVAVSTFPTVILKYKRRL